MPTPPERPFKLFLSYAHKNEINKDRLKPHLEYRHARNKPQMDQVGEAMGNFATGWYLSGESLAAIALALQDLGEPHREAGIALFERQLEFNLPQAREMTRLLDKRTLNPAAPPRPRRRRLPRKRGA